MSNNHNKYLDEVLSLIERTQAPVPAHRAAFRQGFSFSKEPFETQLAIWHHIWKRSGSFRAQMHAFFFLEQYVNKKELLNGIWDTSVSWQEEVDDWPLCDALAKINTKALEVHPAKVYKQLALWNKEENLWKRRQSLVSLLYYSRTKKIFLPFDKITAFIAPLLTDKEYYVQKGVGWSLRELHTVYPSDALPFLQTNIKNISAIAFTIAIEKMSDAEKNELKAIRKLKVASKK